MPIDLHRYDADRLLKIVFQSHLQDVGIWCTRHKCVAEVIPFSMAVEDKVAKFLEEFEHSVLIRYGVIKHGQKDPPSPG